MILTITLNPAVDMSYHLEHLQLDTVNRVDDVSKTAGGKGLNVARVVHQLEENVGASGFLGGNLGDFIRSEIEQLEIKDFFVNISGQTRNCIAVIHEGKQTEILESGPIIKDEEAALFLENFENFLPNVKLVTMSGSLPEGLSSDFYTQLIEKANKYDKPVILDANGSLLKETLTRPFKPYLIKPNEDELSDLLGTEIKTAEQVKKALHDSLFDNIPWIVVTLGDKGAIIKNNSTIFHAKVPKIEAVNPVGSGDSVVAGFSVGIIRKMDSEQLIKFGLTMGVLNALEEKTGSINPENIDKIIGQIELTKI